MYEDQKILSLKFTSLTQKKKKKLKIIELWKRSSFSVIIIIQKNKLRYCSVCNFDFLQSLRDFAVQKRSRFSSD